ncbi:hypothetical protein V6Z11_D04G138900 [Gossypium hirsutum]
MTVLSQPLLILLPAQILLAVKSFKLQRYLDGSIEPPPRVVMDSSGSVKINPAFEVYEQQDSALASWLLSSVGPTVLPPLISLDSASQIWSALTTLFGSKTTSQLMHYRRLLHSKKKGI